VGWISADERHEGYVECIFSDGWIGSGWSDGGITVAGGPNGAAVAVNDLPQSRPLSDVVGWQVACDCAAGRGSRAGWRGQRWTRGDVDDVQARMLRVPDDRVDDLTHADDLPAGKLLYDEWMSQHLGPAFVELTKVTAATTDVEEAQTRLSNAVAAARAAGASWESIGAASGMKRQSAHERWGRG
jgi:hypothetical protein